MSGDSVVDFTKIGLDHRQSALKLNVFTLKNGAEDDDERRSWRVVNESKEAYHARPEVLGEDRPSTKSLEMRNLVELKSERSLS
jgi:hypothetical protein